MDNFTDFMLLVLVAGCIAGIVMFLLTKILETFEDKDPWQ
jgi:uncharacterized membrane protein (DUF106 family)